MHFPHFTVKLLVQKRAEIVYLRSDWLTLVLLTILIGLQATGEMVGCRDPGLQCYCGSMLMFVYKFAVTSHWGISRSSCRKIDGILSRKTNRNRGKLTGTYNRLSISTNKIKKTPRLHSTKPIPNQKVKIQVKTIKVAQ